MKRIAITVALLLGTQFSSVAQVPDSVMDHYRAYAAELGKASPDKQVVGANAYRAWKEAEKVLGDSKTTGDLALNYAENSIGELDGRSLFDELDKAYRRAVQLAEYYPEGTRFETRIMRELEYAPFLIDRSIYKSSRGKPRKLLNAVRKRLEEKGWDRTTYFADTLSMLSQVALIDGKDEDALAYAELAASIYGNEEDNLTSTHRYTYPLFEAVAFERLGRDADALKAMQRLIDEHSRLVNGYTGPSITAYTKYLELMDRLEDEGSDDPAILEAMSWTPPTFETDGGPAMRVPPVMPARAERSGWVRVRFDLDEFGRVMNPTVIDFSEPLFEEAALASIEKWVYPPGMSATDRTGVESQISFKLRSAGGKMLKSKKPFPEIP